MSEELMSVCDLLLLKSNTLTTICKEVWCPLLACRLAHRQNIVKSNTCHMHCPHKDVQNIHKSVFYSAHNPPSDPSQNCFLTRLLTK